MQAEWLQAAQDGFRGDDSARNPPRITESPNSKAVAMALSLAHALEFPGKLRLGKDAYLAVQQIYYPGFTFGGFVGELAAAISQSLI
jgi:hypothetical protein